MKLSVKIAALMIALTMIVPIFFACKNMGGDNITDNHIQNNNEVTTAPEIEEQFLPETEKGVVTAPEAGAKIYNIIFTLATVPPVLAALDAIESGHETYALIERGKTYNGIDEVAAIENAGFDPANNLSNGFTSAEFNLMVEKVRELREAEENSFFYFYSQDGTALRCAAIAANANIPLEDFHVYMCEDGSGAYKTFRDTFVDGKTASEERDEPYDAFMSVLSDAGMNFTTVMSRRDNKNSDEALKYNIASAFALSLLPNFTYWLQSQEQIEGILRETGTSALPAVFGIEGGEGDGIYSANLRYRTISDKISALAESQKAEYLTLMYGDYYENTYAALTRDTRAGEPAPGEKLVFIGARYGYYPNFASEEKYGIGGLGENDVFPESYRELDAKYKNVLLFNTEADYNAFLSVINDSENYPEGAPADVIEEIRRECFNLYIDYIFTMKFTYSLYGGEYDIILKGHPREVLGAYDEWGKRYNVVRTEVEGDGLKETKYCFDKLLDRALIAFHDKDSTGKYIGMVPFGTAAENLAYLGVPITVCGLPSSTYSGLDTGVPVLFVIAETDESICGDDSQVKDRFNAGNLTYEENGEDVTTAFYNSGSVCKYAARIFKDAGDKKTAEELDRLFDAWLAANRPGSDDVDAQGFGK